MSGSVDADILQFQVDCIDRSLPELSPYIVPRTVTKELLQLASKEGPVGCQALVEVLAAAGEGISECSICGETGDLKIDPSPCSSESKNLRASLQVRINVQERSVQPTRCLFLCGLCRQLRNPTSVIQVLAAARESVYGEITEGLLSHLAMINGMHKVAENPQLCYAWGQDVLNQIYSVQRLLSDLKDWKLVKPDGERFVQGKQCETADLALQLLLPELGSEQRREAISDAVNSKPTNAAASKTGEKSANSKPLQMSKAKQTAGGRQNVFPGEKAKAAQEGRRVSGGKQSGPQTTSQPGKPKGKAKGPVSDQHRKAKDHSSAKKWTKRLSSTGDVRKGNQENAAKSGKSEAAHQKTAMALGTRRAPPEQPGQTSKRQKLGKDAAKGMQESPAFKGPQGRGATARMTVGGNMSEAPVAKSKPAKQKRKNTKWRRGQ